MVALKSPDLARAWFLSFDLTAGREAGLFHSGMRLTSLDIRNFRVIRKASIRFEDRVIGIIGANGAGKSTIVEAVAWALYGHQVARSGKDEIRSAYAPSGENCRVCLQFDLGREHYRLVRELVGRQGRVEVRLYRNGSSESVGSIDTGRYLVELLGLDWRGFLTSFLARQQELNALADLAPGERREHLAGMLGVDRLDRALHRVKDDRRWLGQKVLLLENQLSHVDSLNESLVRLREHTNRLEQQQDSLRGASDAARQALAEAEARYREHQDMQVMCSRLDAELKATHTTRDHLSTQRQALRVREDNLRASERTRAELAKQLEDFDRCKMELAQAEKLSDQASRRVELQDRVRIAEQQIAETERTLAERQAELSSLLEKSARIAPDIADRLEAVSAQLEEARRRWTECRGDVKANEQVIARLRDQIEEIGRVGPDAVCDRCLRPFGDDLPRIRVHLDRELTESVSIGEKLQQRLVDLKDEGEKLRLGEADLQREVREKREFGVREQSLRREISGLEAHRFSIDEQAEQSRAQRLALSGTDLPPGRLEELKREVERLEEVRAQALQLRGEVSGLPEVAGNLRDTESRLREADAEIRRIEQKLTRLGFDEPAFDRVTTEFSARQRDFDQARTASLEGAKELEVVRKELELKEEELARLAETASKLDEYRTDQFYAEKLTTLFTDFRKHTISRIRPRLAELASQLIVEMSGGRYSLVDLDEDYNLQIMDNGCYYGIDRFSGGEKDLASLCLRLAISLALTESAGLDRSFVILDEVFGSQDAGRRELIFESLANLTERFPQMILITHLDELKDKVETLIELEPQPGGWSEVRINGRVA